MPVLFKSLLYGSGLAAEYMSHDYSECDPQDYDISQLRDFDKIIEILARFKWLVSSWNIVEEERYNGPATDRGSDDRAAKRALIAYYKGETIPRGKKVTKLYQKFLHYREDANRIFPEDSLVANKNKIALFIDVIKDLAAHGEKTALQRAKKDYEQLEKAITEYVYLESDLNSLKNLR
jgi:hypothetical protein